MARAKKVVNVDPVLRQKADLIEKLKKKNESLEEENSGIRQELDAAKRELEDLKPRIETLEKLMPDTRQVAKTLKDLEETNASLRQEIEQLRKQREEGRKRESKLTLELEETSNKFEYAYSRLIMASEDCEQLQKEGQRWRAKWFKAMTQRQQQGKIRAELDVNYAAVRDALQRDFLENGPGKMAKEGVEVDVHKFPDADLGNVVKVLMEFDLELKTDLAEKKPEGSYHMWMRKKDGSTASWESITQEVKDALKEKEQEKKSDEMFMNVASHFVNNFDESQTSSATGVVEATVGPKKK